MHPAYSVIVFTTASGAGYGLLFWLAVLGALGVVPATWQVGLGGLGLAFILISAGLLSSTSHLGRPERAWRAFSQWRTSWLSREGIAAVATFVPMAILAHGWIVHEWISPAAWLAAALALVTVWCTGMIYQSLPTIRAWSQPLVTPLYVVLALATGGVLLAFVLAMLGEWVSSAAWVAILPLAAAWVMKASYWSATDSAPRTWTTEAATGLGRIGKVRPLDPPHTQANYVMREMGYRVARQHAEKLRRLVTLALFAVPLACAVALIAAGPWLAVVLGLLAAASATIGVLTERWLFFAEAEHVSMLYYGRDAA